MTHTEGPWNYTQLDPSKPNCFHIVYNNDPSQPDYLATCAEKDAALIAAAPEMLEALLSCDNNDYYFDGEYEIAQQSFDAALVKKAIAKAKGELND